MLEEDGIVSQNIEKLREYGVSLGLSDIEIDKCLYDALVNDTDKAKGDKVIKEKKPKSKQSSSCLTQTLRFLKTTTKYFCILIAVMFLGYSWVMWHMPTQRIVMRTLQPHAYNLQRYLRFATMMLPKYIDTSAVSDTMCLVNNPFFEEPNQDCTLCRGVTTATTITRRQLALDFQSHYYAQGRPFIVEDIVKNEVSLKTFFESFKNNAKNVKQGFTFLQTQGVSVKSFQQVFMNLTEKDFEGEGKDHSQVHIRSKSVGATQILRSLFPRPFFIPWDSEVTIDRMYFIDGPKGKPHSFPKAIFPNTFYIQATGTRKLVFSPYKECGKVCATFEILVQPKEIVYYFDQTWKVESVPSNPEGTGDLSFGILGSFS